ncbi:MAG: rhomboid family intramembrane serine protease [Nanoarchaeota archaeon]
MKQKFYSLWISLLLIIIFIFQITFPKFTELFLLNQRTIQNLEIWRYLTAIFLHSSLTHLLFNLFALIVFGIYLEKIIGSKRFIITFLLSGIIANIIALNFYDSSLGASGAIYGLIGALTILKPTMIIYAFGMILPMFIATIIYIITDILRTLGAFDSNIGAIAHLSGIIIGFLFGIYFRLKLKNKDKIEKRTKINFDESSLKEWEDKFIK